MAANKQIPLSDINAGNLPSDFVINNPRDYIAKFRGSFLFKARSNKRISVEELSAATRISTTNIKRIENGHVTEQDMADLYTISEFFNLDYQKILAVFRLVERSTDYSYGVAAYSNGNVDKETHAALFDLLESLKKERD